MRKGICKLCLSEADLCHSHIIPKRYFKRILKNESEKRIKVLARNTSIFRKPYQDGYKDYLFCKECELRLNRYETPYFNFITRFGDVKLDGFSYLLNDSMQCDPEYYRILKLFLLSILWRMSIVKTSTFLDVNLGSYEDKLRKMILNNDPKDYLTLPIICLKLKNNKIEGFPLNPDDLVRILIHPYPDRMYGRNGYHLILDSFEYLIIIDKQPINTEYEFSMIKESGELPVINADKHIVEALTPFLGMT